MTEISSVCFLGYGLHPPWSEGTRVLTRDEMRAVADHTNLDVNAVSTAQAGSSYSKNLNIEYVAESAIGDLVERLGGYRYNLDIPMLGRLAWSLRKQICQETDVVHAGFASHSIYSAVAELSGEVAFVAQTFGGIKHSRFLRLLDTPSRIDAYVTTTAADVTALQSFGVPDTKIHRLNPPVFVDQFETKQATTNRSEFGLSTDAFVIGYFGNVNERRFPPDFAERLNEFAARADIEALVVTKQIEYEAVRRLENVKIVERHLTDSEKRQAYSVADVWTFPFRFKSSESAPVIDPPLTVLEAMASGRPVVATDSLALSNAIKDGHNGFLLAPTDIDGLFDAIDYLRNRPNEKERFGKAARKTINQKYSPGAVAQQLQSIYEEARKHARN